MKVAWSDVVLLAGAVVVIAFAGFMIARDPVIGFAIGVAPIVLYLIVRSAAVRLLLVVAGGMLVLGSSSDVGVNKILYAGLVLVCAAISAYRLAINPPAFTPQFRILLPWGVAAIAIIGISFVASPGGSDVTIFARQSIFYLLVILGPVIGLDAGRDLKSRTVYWIIGLVGVVAAVGFAFDWLERRGVTTLDIGRFVLSSLLLPALAFSLALVLVFHAKSVIARACWAVVTIAIPVAMLVTGTRTNLVVFIAILAVLGRLVSFRVPPLRMLLYVGVAGVVGFAVFPIVAGALVSDPGFIASRVQAALTVVTGDAGADASFTGRSSQFAMAMDVVGRSPLLGMGLGWAVPFTTDAPLIGTVVRLGWAGTAVMIAFLIAISRAVYTSRRAWGPSAAHTAWWGFVAVTIISTLFGTPFEDRGFGFAIMLATMAVAAANAEGARRMGEAQLLHPEKVQTGWARR